MTWHNLHDHMSEIIYGTTAELWLLILEDNVYYYVPVELELLFCLHSKSLDTQ